MTMRISEVIISTRGLVLTRGPWHTPSTHTHTCVHTHKHTPPCLTFHFLSSACHGGCLLSDSSTCFLYSHNEEAPGPGAFSAGAPGADLESHCPCCSGLGEGQLASHMRTRLPACLARLTILSPAQLPHHLLSLPSGGPWDSCAYRLKGGALIHSVNTFWPPLCPRLHCGSGPGRYLLSLLLQAEQRCPSC